MVRHQSRCEPRLLCGAMQVALALFIGFMEGFLSKKARHGVFHRQEWHKRWYVIKVDVNHDCSGHLATSCSRG
jgi:hypothetical protein